MGLKWKLSTSRSDERPQIGVLKKPEKRSLKTKSIQSGCPLGVERAMGWVATIEIGRRSERSPIASWRMLPAREVAGLLSMKWHIAFNPTYERIPLTEEQRLDAMNHERRKNRYRSQAATRGSPHVAAEKLQFPANIRGRRTELHRKRELTGNVSARTKIRVPDVVST